MRFARSQIICWSALLLLLLSGCGSAPAQPSPTHASAVPTPTFLPTPTNTPLPFLPHDHDPFQATFNESSSFTACPASSRPTDVCWNVAGTGTSIPYGPISFSSFDSNFRVPGQPSIVGRWNFCEPTTRQGSLAIGADTIRFTASGTFCPTLVDFVYQVTGGTGTFRHAQCKGSISIPTTNPLQQFLEYWTGTLTP